jgi:hypothetical protein
LEPLPDIGFGELRPKLGGGPQERRMAPRTAQRILALVVQTGNIHEAVQCLNGPLGETCWIAGRSTAT